MAALRFVVIGTGAVGGLYGGLLQRAGHEVHFLLRSDFEWVQSHGLRITTPTQDFCLPVAAYRQVADIPPCDVVLIALKATHNALLTELVPPVLKPGGWAVLLQNGLGGEDILVNLIGPERVAGGLCFLCANRVGPGHILHLDYGEITLGSWQPENTPLLEPLVSILKEAGIPARLAPELLLARWQKLLWNIPFNGLSVVLRATTDGIMADPASRALAQTLMEETWALAAAAGYPLPVALIPRLMAHTAAMKPYQTSMKLDFDQGRPMEVEAIFGHPLRVGGGNAPTIAAIYRQLQFWNGQIAKKIPGSEDNE